MGMIEEQAAGAAANRRRVMEAARAGSRSAPVPVRVIAEQTGMSARAVSDHVRALVEAGLVERAGARGGLWLTPAGRRELTGEVDTVEAVLEESAPLALRRVLDVLPCEEYRSFVRLAVGAVVARHHLLSSTDAGWPSFIALGPTRLGKTEVLARAVCVALGLRLVDHTAMLAGRSRRQILGRSVQRQGRLWEFEPAASLGRPVVVYDEIHEATGDAAAAWRDLAHGASTVEPEDGHRVEVRPVLLSLGNLGAGAALVGGYGGGPVPVPANLARRGVVLDVRALAGIRSRVPDAARAVVSLERTVRPVPLSRLRPVDELPEPARLLLGSVEKLLTPAGAELFDVRALSLVALGVAAFMPASWSPEERGHAAAGVVALDYLTVTSTCPGQVVPGWADYAEPVRAWLSATDGGGGVPLPTLATTDREQVAADNAREVEATELHLLLGKRRTRLGSDVTAAQVRLKAAVGRRRLAKGDADRHAEVRSALDVWGGRAKATKAADNNDPHAVRAALDRLDELEPHVRKAIDGAAALASDLELPTGGLRRPEPTKPMRAAARRAPKPKPGEQWINGVHGVPTQADLDRAARRQRPV